jgi:thiamine transport system substrate-binding protein
MPSTRRRTVNPLAALAVAALQLAACGSSGAGSSGAGTASAGTTSGAAAGSAGAGEVTLITHDSFVVDDALLADFEKSSGLQVTVLAQGDAGAMVNQLLLTASNPLGDVVFGIDNTFASRALAAGSVTIGSPPSTTATSA